MIVSFCTKLTAIVLLVTVFFAPLTSIAHDLKSAAIEQACACQMLSDDFPHDGTGPSDEIPCHGPGDCGDHEECSHDAMDQAHVSGLSIKSSPVRLYHIEPARTFPQVYLAIFVPPEN